MKLIAYVLIHMCMSSVAISAPLGEVEKFHSKMLELSRVKGFYLRYCGILSRTSDQTGLIRENHIEWQIGQKNKPENIIYLRLCDKKGDFIVQLGNVKLPFEVYDNQNNKIKDGDVFSNITGYTLSEFSKAIEKTPPLHSK